MSVIKQPFQMLPFYQSIESQWRLRSDCFNDLCDIPIIPKGKFIPFAIITDSDNVGNVYLHCWDEPFKYERTQDFTRNNCDGVGGTVSFTKIYYSTISPADAYNTAMIDPDYLTEGQTYANNNGSCTPCTPDFFDQYNSESELSNYSGTNHPSNYSDASLTIVSGTLNIDETVESPRQPALLIIRHYRNDCAILNTFYKVSFDLISFNANLLRITLLGTITSFVNPELGTIDFIIESVNQGEGYTGEFEIVIMSFGSSPIHIEIDNLKLEAVEPNYAISANGDYFVNNVGSYFILNT